MNRDSKGANSRADFVGNIALVVLAGCVLVTTAFVVKREYSPPTATLPGARVQTVKDWRKYDVGANRMGPETAPVTIIEFSDFQCPFCLQLSEALGRLRLKYPTQTTVLFRHFPLVNAHAFAFSAAVAAECAAEQGRFVAYHDLLFQNQKRFTDTLWQSLATQANVLDSARFARCLGRDETADRVNRDIAAGNELGVTGTPTVLVGDMRLLGAPSFAKLDTIVQKALRR